MYCFKLCFFLCIFPKQSHLCMTKFGSQSLVLRKNWFRLQIKSVQSTFLTNVYLWKYLQASFIFRATNYFLRLTFLIEWTLIFKRVFKSVKFTKLLEITSITCKRIKWRIINQKFWNYDFHIAKPEKISNSKGFHFNLEYNFGNIHEMMFQFVRPGLEIETEIIFFLLHMSISLRRGEIMFFRTL